MKPEHEKLLERLSVVREYLLDDRRPGCAGEVIDAAKAIRELSADVARSKEIFSDLHAMRSQVARYHNEYSIENVQAVAQLKARAEAAEKHSEWCSAKLCEHAEAAGVDPDHVDFIDQTTNKIIDTWAENARLAEEVHRKNEALEDLLIQFVDVINILRQRREAENEDSDRAGRNIPWTPEIIVPSRYKIAESKAKAALSPAVENRSK